MKVDVIYQKSCQRMTELPDESIDTILTSCPYWGLRNYGEDVKEIWGGDPDCEHKWAKEIYIRRHKAGETNPGKEGYTKNAGAWSESGGNFCLNCNAWHGQLGLEPTFHLYLDHMMIVCAEIKRVLKKTGSFWLNMGDTYLTGKGLCKNPGGGSKSWKSWNDRKAIFPRGQAAPNRMSKELSPKCLAGIPWRLVLRLIDSEIAYHIESDVERGWLAGLIEGEGCIGIQKLNREKHNAQPAYSIYLRIAMTSKQTLEKCRTLTKFGVVRDKKMGPSAYGRKPMYSWDIYAQQASIVIRDIFPLLTIKRVPAILAYTLQDNLQYTKNTRKLGMKVGVRGEGRVAMADMQLREELWHLIKAYNQGRKISIPDYAKEPPMNKTEGWILRNANIWYKKNSMPSSVKDRLSNSYEFLFHLVKNTKPQYYWNEKTGLMADRKPSKIQEIEDIDWEWRECPKCEGTGKVEEKECPRCKGTGKIKHSFWHSLGYWYDLDAIREPYTEPLNRWGGPKTKETDRSKGDQFAVQERPGRERRPHGAGKNPGDVWTITTQPRPEAHFACFPDRLCIRPILATCPLEICRKCGKARVRITQKPDMSQRPQRSRIAKTFEDKHLGFTERSAGQKYQEWRNENPDITIGWTDCHCGEGFDSGIVLDPFAGRGTALIMAKKLGRHYVGYELKKEYCEKLIKPALEEIDPLFKRR